MIEKIKLCPIGIVEKAGKQEAKIRVSPEFSAGLKDIEDFFHLIILYWIHLCCSTKERETLLVFPRRHTVNAEKGVFACRSPSRPNPIGLCVVKLVRVEYSILTVENLNALEGSPIIEAPSCRVPDCFWQLFLSANRYTTYSSAVVI